MGTKSKGRGRPFSDNGVARPRGADDAKLTIKTYEDVPDSEDEFYINRDKILLDEGPTAKRLRLAQEKDSLLEPSDEEILAASQSEDEFGIDNDNSAKEHDEKTTQAEGRPAKKALGKPLPKSDDESSADAAEDESDGGWGTSRKDYYNADINETEQDALEEEAEARRLQQKQLQGMTEADFGFDEAAWLADGEGDATLDGHKGKVVTQIIPKLQITDDMGTEEKLSILKGQYPEFEPLAHEFVDLQDTYVELQLHARANAVPDNEALHGNGEEPSMSMTMMKYRTLAAYLSALSMYFVLLTSGTQESDTTATAMQPKQLQDHSIMETLVECRDLWHRVSILRERETANTAVTCLTNGSPGAQDDSVKRSKEGPEEFSISKRKQKKSSAQRALEVQLAEAEDQRLARLQKAEASLAGLSRLTLPTKQSKISRSHSNEANDSGSDIGDPTSLTAAEKADKAHRKKSLRFYTSQIAQKSNKRSAAGRGAGGDDDLPYRERWKEKQARIQAEAEKRGKKMHRPGVALGEGSDGEKELSNTAKVQQVEGNDEEEDYYDFVAAQARKKKADKSDRAAQVAAAGIPRTADDEGMDGKRAISYAIQKNKGLTANRKKEVRNPRVKKRKRYEDKKKKLSSMKPVWKGGEGRGGYGGELTGIKKGLVKGVKL